jgi:Cdc6-like AAA superfamily ATPase
MDNEPIAQPTIPEEQDFFTLSVKAGRIFNPTTPVNERDLFSGRTEQIRRIIDVIFQKGQHAIVFGERGVGKTSLANVLSQFVPNEQSNLLSIRINCDRNDDFQSTWRKMFDEIQLKKDTATIGFNKIPTSEIFSVNDLFQVDEITPDEVRKILYTLSNIFLLLLVFDEFDRMQETARRLFADLIKNLSDHASGATIVLIGVGENVEQLIKEHHSVSRSMVQIKMPRMTLLEIKEIISNGVQRLGMTIEKDVINQIAMLSQGLPHYAHLLGLHASRYALDNKSFNIELTHLENAIKKSVSDTQHSIKTDYQQAIRSAHTDNLFAEILLACAIAETNEVGEFAAQDIRSPLEKITGKKYDIPGFARHLSQFCSIKRDNILTKSGASRQFRYKFTDPLMQPYVIMNGILSGHIKADSLFFPEIKEVGDLIT